MCFALLDLLRVIQLDLRCEKISELTRILNLSRGRRAKQSNFAVRAPQKKAADSDDNDDDYQKRECECH
jgi:hypothetical protein